MDRAHRPVPYDIMFRVYFFVTDYPTCCKMFLLDKTFYTMYMRRHNGTYNHKFDVLFNGLFSFLHNMPTHVDIARLLSIEYNVYQDIEMFSLTTRMCHEREYQTVIRNDIACVVRILSTCLTNHIRPLVIQPELVTALFLMKGPRFLSMLVTPRIQGPRIRFDVAPLPT